MKLGISVTITLGQAKELVDPSDLPHSYLHMIDNVADFARNNSLEWLEIASFPPFSANNLEIIQDLVKQKLEDFNTSFHLPAWEINICALDEQVRGTAVDEIKKSIDLVNYLGIKKTVLHPGSFGTMADVYELFSPLVLKNASQSVAEIVDHASKYDIEINVENLPYGSPFFNKPEDFESFVEAGAGITLDTAHAITSRVDPVEFIHRYKNKIREIHLVDGIGDKPDKHYPPGAGEVDFEALFEALNEIEYEGHYILEMMNPKSAKEGLDFLQRFT